MRYLYSFLAFLLTMPLAVLAAEFAYKTPLVAIPGYKPGDGLDEFVNVLYGLSITVAALLAIIKIVIAGVKWMLSDVVTDKASAKNDIQGALLGLIVILTAVLIISIINPNIVGG